MSIAALPSSNGDFAGKKVYLETFGCQMNELDSELVRGHLRALGYAFTADAEAADVVLYNTCSVRLQAENKVWSRVGIMGRRKREGRRFVLGVIGCMAEREGPAMIRRFPQVDLMCGPGELDKLPMLIENAFKTSALELADRVALQGNNSRRSSTLTAASDNLEMLDLSRAFDPDFSSGGAKGRSAYVRITRGCNKFCTYCVVPYTRGAEVHRPPDSIVDECKKLADQGVIEITLLGQTVNHYIYTHGAAVSLNGAEVPQIGPAFKNVKTSKRQNVQTGQGSGAPTFNESASIHSDISTFRRFDVPLRTTTFADLLHRIHEEVPAIQRLRFVTSFPRDFGDDILQVMAQSPRICKYLHVPAQSGSNRILKLMNRGYTVEEYLEFIDRAQAILAPTEVEGPGVCIAGDIIVGFPTETEEDFELTKELLRRVPFKNNFIFKYSPRPGTVAINRFADDVPEAVKRRRNNDLLNLQTQISAKVHQAFIGKSVKVFVEQISRKTSVPAPPPKPIAQPVAITINSSNPRSNGRGHDSPPTSIENPRETASIQLSGRTEGDLIAVFDLPLDHPGGADDLIGRIVPVEVKAAGPLLLQGRMACTSL